MSSISLSHNPVGDIVCKPEFPLKYWLSNDLNFTFILLNKGFRKKIYKIEINKQLIIEGRIKNQIEIPDDLMTFNSLVLFNLMKVCIELKRKTVGNMIGTRDGKWNRAIFSMILKGISLVELLLKSSIRSIVKNKKQQKKEIVKIITKFCFIK